MMTSFIFLNDLHIFYNLVWLTSGNIYNFLLFYNLNKNLKNENTNKANKAKLVFKCINILKIEKNLI